MKTPFRSKHRALLDLMMPLHYRKQLEVPETTKQDTTYCFCSLLCHYLTLSINIQVLGSGMKLPHSCNKIYILQKGNVSLPLGQVLSLTSLSWVSVQSSRRICQQILQAQKKGEKEWMHKNSQTLSRTVWPSESCHQIQSCEGYEKFCIV